MQKSRATMHLCTYGHCASMHIWLWSQNSKRASSFSSKYSSLCWLPEVHQLLYLLSPACDLRRASLGTCDTSACVRSRPSSRLSPSIFPLIFTNLRRTPVETENFRMNRDRQYSSSVQICFSVLTNDFV